MILAKINLMQWGIATIPVIIYIVFGDNYNVTN